MLVGTRDDAERLLANALSRSIGYTSGAYDLERIFSVLDVFSERTSVYRDEAVAFLGESSNLTRDTATTTEYRSEILNFASSMGLIEAVSAREARLVRYAATELGRSLLGARATGDLDFARFYSAEIVLRADADFLIPILLFARRPALVGLHAFFAEFQAALRAKRLNWLLESFSEPILVERIAGRLTWLKRRKGGRAAYEVDQPTLNTARHHATPRQGWIVTLGMVHPESHSLTAFGSDVVDALSPSGEYFWLAPPDDVLRSLNVVSQFPGQAEDCMTIGGATIDASNMEVKILVEDVARTMIRGYRAAKLVHASQASLYLPIEYIRYRGYVDRRAYDWSVILDAVFHDYRDRFQRYSARKGRIGFYRVTG